MPLGSLCRVSGSCGSFLSANTPRAASPPTAGRVFCDVMCLVGVGRNKAGYASGLISGLIGVGMFAWGVAGSVQSGGIQTTVFIGAWIAKEAFTVLQMVRCALAAGGLGVSLAFSSTSEDILAHDLCRCPPRGLRFFRRGRARWRSTRCSRRMGIDVGRKTARGTAKRGAV